ncbi:hypothetical protein KC845_02285 [Candidatus Kaiserbacteria bacterium]|nr:hypothetical protein [Candidatus Kaiserbacteria bacterium]
MPQIQIGRLLTAGVILAFTSLISVFMLTESDDIVADMKLNPTSGTYEINEEFEVLVEVSSKVPVNVFSGDIWYDPKILNVKSINYNTKVADLWAVEPWFENGDGTITFAGGTTKKNGFTGNGTLLNITFESIAEGEGSLQLVNSVILKHDGLGSETKLASDAIDAIFTIAPEQMAEDIVAKPADNSGHIKTIKQKPSTDLNNDGKTTVVDVSIFMIHLSSQNKLSDFNQDNKVNTKDLSIILNDIKKD